MRKSSSASPHAAFASQYCCIMGVVAVEVAIARHRNSGLAGRKAVGLLRNRTRARVGLRSCFEIFKMEKLRAWCVVLTAENALLLAAPIQRRSCRNNVVFIGFSYYSSGLRITGSIVLVLRSRARIVVLCSKPSELSAATGMTWRRFGSCMRTVKVPSGRSVTGSPLSVT